MVAPDEEFVESQWNEVKNDVFGIDIKLAYVINGCRRYHYLQVA